MAAKPISANRHVFLIASSSDASSGVTPSVFDTDGNPYTLDPTDRLFLTSASAFLGGSVASLAIESADNSTTFATVTAESPVLDYTTPIPLGKGELPEIVADTSGTISITILAAVTKEAGYLTRPAWKAPLTGEDPS